jgi:ATP-dependent DNA helicase RecQ
MKEESEPQIRNWIDQLLSQGFLRQAGEFNCLELTVKGRDLLKGNVTPALLRAQVAESAAPAGDQWEGVDRELFEELRAMRTRLAVQKQVPPYIIFGDATLRDLARHRPTKAESLTRIHGIGAQKQTEFGPVVLLTILEWCEAHGIPTDIDLELAGQTRPTERRRVSRPAGESASSEYFDLFEKGLSMEDVALQLGRSLDTVSRYLNTWIEAHRVTDIDIWIPPALQDRINAAIGQVGCERLKPLFEALNGEVAYHHLRIAATVWNLRQAEDH